MPSSLTWIDHDSAARERTQRILALFTEKEARDELGLGPISGAISDQLFPGTSTIQTRLRYAFFIPWIYQRLANEKTPNHRVERAEKETEQQLITALLETSDTQGVLGQRARESLTRYASSVYWANLGSWGIRHFDGSQEDLHTNFDVAEAPWDPQLPAAPATFPQGASFQLTKEEASYLRDKLVSRHASSLLTHLAVTPLAIETLEAPWELEQERVLPAHRVLLREARRFGTVMYGASILYNLMLSEEVANDDWRTLYMGALERWLETLPGEQLASWDVVGFWPHVLGRGHNVTTLTRSFVTDWVNVARSGSADVVLGSRARGLVERRERMLKGPQSRFASPRTLSQWRGASGAFGNTFRWRTARRFLLDLYAAEV